MDRMVPDYTKLIKICRILALNQFYSIDYGFPQDKHIMWDNFYEIMKKCENYETYFDGVKELEEVLTFPHHILETCYNSYEKISGKILKICMSDDMGSVVSVYFIIKF